MLIVPASNDIRISEYSGILGSVLVSQPDVSGMQTGEWKTVITAAKDWGLISHAGNLVFGVALAAGFSRMVIRCMDT